MTSAGWANTYFVPGNPGSGLLGERERGLDGRRSMSRLYPFFCFLPGKVATEDLDVKLLVEMYNNST